MSDYQYPAALPVTTTGGWARPGWWDILADAEKQGRFGPADRRELLDDYCQLAINDQEMAGLDILTDGEHRRGGWIEGITGKMAGLALRPPPRRLGAIGWDMLPVYEVREPLEAVESIWDFTGEYRFLAARTSRRPKIGMPGPYGRRRKDPKQMCTMKVHPVMPSTTWLMSATRFSAVRSSAACEGVSGSSIWM